MAASGESIEQAIARRLNYLLRRASEVKRSTAIDPPLQVSELVPENEPLLEHTAGDKDKDVYLLSIETAAKNIFYAHLGSTPINNPSFVTVWNLLDILQYFGDQNICYPSLVLRLVEELLDCQSIAGCKIAFRFLESRREAIIASRLIPTDQAKNDSKNKDLVILRLCNELLRRLSRAEEPVFCGRVYIFLFQSFPLGDKSSVNLRGNFHVENVTTFEDYLKETKTGEDEMQINSVKTDDDVKLDSKAEGEETNSKLTEHDQSVKEKPTTMDIEALYPVFWSLQQSFSNPPSLFEGDSFKQFQKSLEATLAKFKEVPKVIQSGDVAHKIGTEAQLDKDHEELASTFNPKYLTSRDLFKLELSDLAFQRHILVQALILLDFLLTLTEKSKGKPYYQEAQKAMQYSFTLGEEETEWALGIKTAIANYLQDGPDGKHYYRMVDTVLSRDKNWVRWKMENCQPFTRDRLATKDAVEAKSGSQRAITQKRGNRPTGVDGTFEFLSKDAEKGLDELRQDINMELPSTDRYVKKHKVLELDLEMARTEEEKRQLGEEISSNTWRGFRVASKKQLSSFDRIEQGKGLEALQPVTSSIEATGEDNAPTTPEDRDAIPQEEHQSVEEQRAGQQSQVTAAEQ